MARRSRFSVPSPRPNSRTANAAELHALLDEMELESTRLVLTEAGGLLLYWSINGPPEDASLVRSMERIRDRCALVLAEAVVE